MQTSLIPTGYPKNYQLYAEAYINNYWIALKLPWNWKDIKVNSFAAVISSALTEPEIRRDWQWLLDNVCPTLHSFDTEEEVTEFVCCKINSIIATEQENYMEGLV